MKPIPNPKYLEYKVFFMLSAYDQQAGYYNCFHCTISKKISELFIINNNLNILPEFICYNFIETTNKNYLNRVGINVNGINNITYKLIHTISDLIRNKYNETES